MGFEEFYWLYSVQNRYVNLKYGEPRIITLQEGLSMIGDRVDPDFKIQENANKVIVHKNGIKTSPEDAMYQLYTLCRYHNTNGHLIYNPTHNRDLAECVALKRGCNTQMTYLMRDFYTELVEKNPDIHILASYHSEAGLFENNCAKLLSPEVKKHIYYFGVAPANIVPSDGCLGCFNVRSNWDLVPKFSEENWEKYPDICKTIYYPKYSLFSTKFEAHAFHHPMYDRDKEDTIDLFMNL